MNCILYPQFIALGTGDGTIKLLDHTGTTLMDRIYTLVGTLSVVVSLIFYSLQPCYTADENLWSEAIQRFSAKFDYWLRQTTK